MFSIIIPTKNRSAMLQRAMQSVLVQTDQEYEIIVVDDGSDAQEAEAIAQLVAATEKAKLIRVEVAQGAPRARNRAIATANGDIIALLDSDDWWRPDRLTLHRQAMAGPDIVLSYNIAALTQGANEDVVGKYGSAPHPNRAVDVSLAGRNYIGGCSSVCFKAEAFRTVGGFDPDLPSCQDWDLWWRLIRQGALHFLAVPLTYQDIGPHERITSSPAKVIAGHDKVEQRFLQPHYSADDRRFIKAQQHYVRAEIGARFADPAMIRKHLTRSLAIRPSAIVLKRLPQLIRAGLGI